MAITGKWRLVCDWFISDYGLIYRNHDNPLLESFVTTSRSKFCQPRFLMLANPSKDAEWLSPAIAKAKNRLLQEGLCQCERAPTWVKGASWEVLQVKIDDGLFPLKNWWCGSENFGVPRVFHRVFPSCSHIFSLRKPFFEGIHHLGGSINGGTPKSSILFSDFP